MTTGKNLAGETVGHCNLPEQHVPVSDNSGSETVTQPLNTPKKKKKKKKKTMKKKKKTTTTTTTTTTTMMMMMMMMMMMILRTPL